MHKITPSYYLGFRPKDLLSRKYSHILLLIFWPLFGIAFLILENWQRNYYPIYSPIDDFIPFCPPFIFAYYFWFIFMIGMLVYTFFYNLRSFRQYMWFIIITYTVTLIIYILFPNRQDLRPEVKPDGLITSFICHTYAFDTNTNVCPSIHVLGSLAVSFTAKNCEQMRRRWMQIAIHISTALICASTVFLKQHSIIDVVAALVVAALVYPLVYGKGRVASTLSNGRAVTCAQ